MITIGHPALEYVESLDIAAEDVRGRFVARELRESIGARTGDNR